jgi:hypothetical protein
MILRGDLDLLTAALFSERLARAMASQPDGLVLDLARLAFIDCAGARAMAAGRPEAAARPAAGASLAWPGHLPGPPAHRAGQALRGRAASHAGAGRRRPGRWP